MRRSANSVQVLQALAIDDKNQRRDRAKMSIDPVRSIQTHLGDAESAALNALHSIRLASAPRLVAMVLCVHAVETAAILVGAQQPLQAEGTRLPSELDPRSLPGAWLRYDASYYLTIARTGYPPEGPALGFMPVYPLLVRALSVVQDPVVLAWAGLVISNVACCAALLFLWHEVKRVHGRRIAWTTVITLTVFPTGFFFSAFYTESLFLLGSVLTYWLSRRRNFYLAGMVIAAMSLTRINGLVLLVLPLSELLLTRPKRWPITLAITATTSSLGLILYAAYMLLTRGDAFAFLDAQRATMLRTADLPWNTVIDSARVVLGLDSSFSHNWFMRAIALQDLLATIVFVGGAILGVRVLNASLETYLVIALVVLTISHGPYTLGLYSMSRYVLGLFPAFIVFGIALQQHPYLRNVIWAASVGLLLGLSAWFGTGRWVA
jgi:mannosyltransferase PIG-V